MKPTPASETTEYCIAEQTPRWILSVLDMVYYFSDGARNWRAEEIWARKEYLTYVNDIGDNVPSEASVTDFCVYI